MRSSSDSSAVRTSLIRVARRGVAALGFTLVARSLLAQASGPVFQIQPGLATADFYSAPGDAASTTGFLLRFLTRFPTGRMWLNPVIGAALLPYGSTGTGNRNTDAPTLFAGNVFRLVDGGAARWISLELPVLVTHAPGAGPTGNVRDYGRDLVVQPTLYVHLGPRLFSDFGAQWSRVDLYAYLEQNLTPNRDPVRDARDRLNPVAVFGVSLGLGPARE